jgi:hypothetical protein
MTVVRKMAFKISALVIRFSSAGNKEWAAGVAGEIDFIENDWKALAWAMGSLRVLLDRKPAPIRSLEDFEILKQKYVKSKRFMYFFLGSCGLQAFNCVRSFIGAHSYAMRIGFGMMAISWIVIGADSLLELRRSKKLRSSKDSCDFALLYRAELKRILRSFHSVTASIGKIAWVLILIGMAMTNLLSLDFLLFIILATLFGIFFAHRDVRQRLEQLDAFLATQD